MQFEVRYLILCLYLNIVKLTAWHFNEIIMYEAFFFIEFIFDKSDALKRIGIKEDIDSRLSTFPFLRTLSILKICVLITS